MESYYDAIAPGYEELHRDEQLRKLKFIASAVEPEPDDMVLDVGCGTALAADFFDCRYVGLDPAFELLRSADAPVVQGVAEELPFKDDSFDMVICVSALHNFESPERAIDEMIRVGKNKFVLTVFRKGRDVDKLESLVGLVRNSFEVQMEVEDEHDLIFFCTRE